eukprot:Nk52_evm81s210 gene=Nk52_evmTU81s210
MNSLPAEFKSRLDDIESALAEGDITQKGYDKLKEAIENDYKGKLQNDLDEGVITQKGFDKQILLLKDTGNGDSSSAPSTPPKRPSRPPSKPSTLRKQSDATAEENSPLEEKKMTEKPEPPPSIQVPEPTDASAQNRPPPPVSPRRPPKPPSISPRPKPVEGEESNKAQMVTDSQDDTSNEKTLLGAPGGAGQMQPKRAPPPISPRHARGPSVTSEDAPPAVSGHSRTSSVGSAGKPPPPPLLPRPEEEKLNAEGAESDDAVQSKRMSVAQMAAGFAAVAEDATPKKPPPPKPKPKMATPSANPLTNLLKCEDKPHAPPPSVPHKLDPKRVSMIGENVPVGVLPMKMPGPGPPSKKKPLVPVQMYEEDSGANLGVAPPPISPQGNVQGFSYGGKDEHVEDSARVTTLSQISSLGQILELRSQLFLKKAAYVVVDGKGKETQSIIYPKIHSKAQKMAAFMTEKLNVQKGQRVALFYPSHYSLDFLGAFYGCIYAGIVAVPVPKPRVSSVDMYTRFMDRVGSVLKDCGAMIGLSCEEMKPELCQSGDGKSFVGYPGWPEGFSFRFTDNLPSVAKKNRIAPMKFKDVNTIAYVDVQVGMDISSELVRPKAIPVTHCQLLHHLENVSATMPFTSEYTVVSPLDASSGLGFYIVALLVPYTGMSATLVPNTVFYDNPLSMLHAITKSGSQIVLCTNECLNLCCHLEASNPPGYEKEKKTVKLSSVEYVLVDTVRARSEVCDKFFFTFQNCGIGPDVFCPVVWTPETGIVSCRPRSLKPIMAHLDARALRYDTVVFAEGDKSVSSISIPDSGKIVSNTGVSIFKIKSYSGIDNNTSLRTHLESVSDELCQEDEIGEIVVFSNACGYVYEGTSNANNSKFVFNEQLLSTFQEHIDHSCFSEMPQSNALVRTGLFGFITNGNRLYVTGSYGSRYMYVNTGGFKSTPRSISAHYTDDLEKFVREAKPINAISGLVATFMIPVHGFQKLVIVAETSLAIVADSESIKVWNDNVVNILKDRCGIDVLSVMLVPAGSLPCSSLRYADIALCKQMFLRSQFYPVSCVMNVSNAIQNLPDPRRPGAQGVTKELNDILTGCQVSEYTGEDVREEVFDESTNVDLTTFSTIAEVLRWRAKATPTNVVFSTVDEKGAIQNSLTCEKLHVKVERMAAYLLEKTHLLPGDHVALIYPAGMELPIVLYACFYLGYIPVLMHFPKAAPGVEATEAQHMNDGLVIGERYLSQINAMLKSGKCKKILTTELFVKMIGNKEIHKMIQKLGDWPEVLSTHDPGKKKFTQQYYKPPTNEMMAYLDVNISTTGVLKGMRIGHDTLNNECRALKDFNLISSASVVVCCIDPLYGLGLNMWCFLPVYCGCNTILLPPSSLDNNPLLWFKSIAVNRAMLTLTSYPIIEICLRELTDNRSYMYYNSFKNGKNNGTCFRISQRQGLDFSSTKNYRPALHQDLANLSKEDLFKKHKIDLSCVSNCLVYGSERSRGDLATLFLKEFEPFGLKASAISPAFGCACNTIICTRGHVQSERRAMNLDLKGLSEDKVVEVAALDDSDKEASGDSDTFVSKSLRPVVKLVDSGKVLPKVKIAVVNPETLNHCTSREIGEIWVSSPHNSKGYYAVPGETEDVDVLTQNDFMRALKGNPNELFARTGYTGYLREASSFGGDANRGEKGQLVFITGQLNETIFFNGFRFYPGDIELSVEKSSTYLKSGGSCLFSYNDRVHLVVEIYPDLPGFLRLVPLITTVVLETYHLNVSCIIFAHPNTIPKNANGQKHRIALRDAFAKGTLQPIFIANNL